MTKNAIPSSKRPSLDLQVHLFLLTTSRTSTLIENNICDAKISREVTYLINGTSKVMNKIPSRLSDSREMLAKLYTNNRHKEQRKVAGKQNKWDKIKIMYL